MFTFLEYDNIMVRGGDMTVLDRRISRGEKEPCYGQQEIRSCHASPYFATRNDYDRFSLILYFNMDTMTALSRKHK